MKTKTFVNMRIRSLILLLCICTNLLQQCQPFQFKAVDVLPDVSSVSTVTSYTINAYRYSTEYLDPTNWDVEPVSAGGTVVVDFPGQYVMIGPVCDSIEVTTESQVQLVTGFNCTIVGRQLTISNLFASPTFVKSLVIRLINILNPSLAITTDSFIVKIGNDVSGNTPMASVIITPTKFSVVNATFDNKTVNTTGNLIVTVVSRNIIKSGSSVVIEFPATLQWTRDISPSHPLPLNTQLTCLSITSNIRPTISCVGSLTQRSITLSNINPSDISINQTIQFKVGQLFSPPSIQEIDEIGIKIKSLYTDGLYYEMDSDKSKITGMVPKTMVVAFSSTSRVTVNSRIAIQLDIVLADTINQLDTLRVYFPTVCNFSLTDTRSSTSGFFINSTSSTYDPVNRVLQMRQRTQTQTNFANKVISLQMSLFTAPPSIKQFGITFQILRQNFTMAQGIAYASALTNSYLGNVSVGDPGVNKVTKYDILVDVKDNHTGTMMIQIVLPTTLSVNSSTFSAKTSLSTSITPTFSITGTTQSTITLSNLITPSNTTILPQILNITLYNITNPSSVKNIGNFIVRTYYNTDLQERVSETSIASLLMTVNGQVAQNSVKLVPKSVVNFDLTTYSMQFVIENVVDINGYFIINLPSELDLSQLTSVQLTTISIPVQSVQFSPINITSIKITNNISRLSFNTQLNFTLANIRNPFSTKPTLPSQVKIQSFNSVGETIDLLNSNNGVSVQMTTVNELKSAKLERGSVKNDQVTIWRGNFTQVQTIESGQVVIMVIDSSAIVGSTISCIDTVTSQNLTCSKLLSRPSSLSSFTSAKPSSTYISIQIPLSYTNQSTFLFTIKQIQNPTSYLPFNISLFTTSSDITYLYSTIQQTYQNSQLSLIGIGSYSFSMRQLKQSTTLSFGYTVVSGFGSLVLEFDGGFGVGSVGCNSVEWPDVACTVISNSSIRITSTNTLSLSPKSATITLTNLITPSTQSTTPSYIKLSTFDLSSQPIGSSTNSISYTLECTFPCKTCSSTNTSQCLSCYKTPISLKEFLGVDKQCYQQCPDGFNENNDTYLCEKCDLPCLYCNGLKNNCTSCNSSTEFVYLSYTASIDTSTCVKACPSKYFPNTNSVPVYCQACQSPCLQCSSPTTCLSCLQTNQTLYLYNGTCIKSCPVDVTVINTVDGSCISCSPQCKTCSILTTNCTTCADTSIFYQGKCLLSCPMPLIKYNSTCVNCDSKCQFCSITPSNCTSCIKTSNFSHFYQNNCLAQCPNFYYPNNTNKLCLQCNNLSIGCKNCTNETSCKSCDSGYVLLGDKCLTNIPIGYINNSGIAVPCAGDCKTCEGTIDNCTSCKTMNLNGNLCQQNCPSGQTAVSQVCTRCQYPCQACQNQVYSCTSCYSNSSMFLYNNECLLNCPDKFYKSTINMICLPCRAPCEKCLDEVTCVSCAVGYFYRASTAQCLVGCPDGMVGENRLCVDCQTPCVTCTRNKTTCESCALGSFLSSATNQCLNQCPSGTIKNQTLRKCQSCTSPCQTCLTSPTQCLTCINNHFFLNDQCYSQCPQTYYSNSTKCAPCTQPCLTCSSQTLCLSCVGSLYLHRQACVSECPKEYGKVSLGICTQCDAGCYACQSSGICTQCLSGYIFYLDQCLTTCPTNYISSKVNSTLTCILKQQSDTKLESSLTSSSSLFPLPFTILGLIIIGAGLISKLQNHNTYLIGLAYSVFGILQTGAVLYVLYCYFFKYQHYQMLTVYLILTGLGIILLLNVLGFVAHTVQLCADKRFDAWTKSSCTNFTTFLFTTLLSLTINFKFKLILFCKIFNFTLFKAELTSVEKFKIFNVFSFLGIFAEAELIYALTKQIVVKKDFSNDLFITFIDCLVILALNVVFSIASSWKSEDFFREEIDGIVINKKIFIEGDVINKDALKDEEEYHPYFSTRKTFNESHEVFKNTAHVIDEFNDEYDESDSGENETNKNSKQIKTKDKLYFEDEDLSSQTLRYKEDLDVKSSKRSQISKMNYNKQSVFEKNIQEQEQIEKNDNDQELRKGGYYISSNTEDIENHSIKQSENVFCVSPRKRQKQNNADQHEKKVHYSEEEEDEKVKKMMKSKDIEDSASHFNQVMKNKQTRELMNDNNVSVKPSTKSRQSRKSKQLPISNPSANSNPKESNQNQSQQHPSSKKLLLQLNQDGNQLQSSHCSEQIVREPNARIFRFEQVSKSLKQSQQIVMPFEGKGEFTPNQDNQIKKIKITSQNSSKTYALPLHLSPPNNNSAFIDSQSETVCQDGRLKPERRQNSIKQIQNQNKIKINTMHYQGQENSIHQEEAPKSHIRNPKYDKEKGDKNIKYDYVGEVEKEEENQPYIPISIENNQLASSEQSYQMEQIEKNPLGYSPQSRIIENKEQSRDISQDEMFLQLHSHMKTERSNLPEGKTLQLQQNRLETIDEALVRQTQFETLSKQTQDPSKTQQTNKHNSLKDKYEKIINTVHNWKEAKGEKRKRNLHLSGEETVMKKQSDIYISSYLEEGQVPIKKREQKFSRDRKYPIQHKSKDRFESNLTPGIQSKTESQFELSPSKISPNRRINIDNSDILTPVYRSNPADLIVQNGLNNNNNKKESQPQKRHSIYQSTNIEFDPVHERINTNTVFGDDLKDELDHFSMKQINFGKSTQYAPTNYANELLQGSRPINMQDLSRNRMNPLISTGLIPRPNIQRFTSPINEHSPDNKNQGISQNSPTFTITNSKSLATYYGHSQLRRDGDSRTRSRQKTVVRSKSRDGSNYGNPNSTKSPQKETQRLYSSGKDAKNQISSNRLKELEKIYLQRLH